MTAALLEVPVVLVDARVRFRGQVNPALWQRLVNATRRGAGKVELEGRGS